MFKATSIAPSNIAFIKYWGRKNEQLRLPVNASISMNLSGLTSKTTVEFSKDFSRDEITIDGKVESEENSVKIFKHIDRIRDLSGFNLKAKIVSENTFPRSTGLSSSASGYAALTVASAEAVGMDLSEKEMSILARQGSGSACRSIPDGFVEWKDGDTSEDSYAESIFPHDYWDIVDVAGVLTDSMKDVSTSDGQLLASTSPFFETRLKKIKNKIAELKDSLAKKDFTKFGEISEAEALEMHAIMITSSPSLIYWYPQTIDVMKAVKKWRCEGLECYFTVNTGQNIHVLCKSSEKDILSSKLEALPAIKSTILSLPSAGAEAINDHLF